MSLVGTRPILQDELQKYELHHRARIAIKPGITGMWQVSGRSDITDFEEVVRLDTELIKSDLFRYAGTTSSKSFIKTYVKEAGFRFSVAFRLVNDGGVLKLFGIILWKLRNHQQMQMITMAKKVSRLFMSIW